jgi:hypothetical protein
MIRTLNSDYSPIALRECFIIETMCHLRLRTEFVDKNYVNFSL